MNPVILLDEVDKIGADWRGDPSAALLEVLDPAQNHSFRDHYLDVELDLSQVLFIATANIADTIPGPLLDRMEVVRFDGYTTEEKVAIARGYLWPRRWSERSRAGEVGVVDDAVLRRSSPTTRARRECASSSASSERCCARPRRRSPRAERRPGRDRHEAVREALGPPEVLPGGGRAHRRPGVATGLAVTGTGGDVLFVEAASMPGKEGLVLTGQLGDVMKESARIARRTCGRTPPSSASTSAFDGREFHVHVPAGAIPKDGPSAGVTMVTALASLLTGARQEHRRHDRRGHAPGARAADRRSQAEGAGGTRGRTHGGVVPELNLGDLEEVPPRCATRCVPPGDDRSMRCWRSRSSPSR